MAHLFSAAADQVQYGAKHYRIQRSDLSTVVNDLFIEYRQEGVTMPYTVEDYKRENARKYLGELTPEELLARLTPEQRLAGLPAEKLLEQLSPEQRLAGLSVEKVLEQLSPDQIESYLRRLRQESPAARKKKLKPRR